MSFKNAKVVMLPTNKKAENTMVLNTTSNSIKIASKSNFGNKLFNTDSYDDKYKFQHLYFTIDEKPNIGDWYLVTIYNIENKPSIVLEKVKSINDGWINNEQIDTTRHIDNCYKVIATTDNSIALLINDPIIGKAPTFYPKSSKSFIQKYIDMYNKNTPITDVLIEYWDHTEEDIQLKINSNNEITIKRAKDSWNRQEIENLTKHSFMAGYQSYPKNDSAPLSYYNIWKKQNL